MCMFTIDDLKLESTRLTLVVSFIVGALIVLEICMILSDAGQSMPNEESTAMRLISRQSRCYALKLMYY